jgi:outer membrane receptor protein involved in Fe transport
VNLKLGYERERWGVHAWMRNAFDQRYAVRGFFFSNEPPDWPDKLYTQQGEPRTIGLTLDVQF